MRPWHCAVQHTHAREHAPRRLANNRIDAGRAGRNTACLVLLAQEHRQFRREETKQFGVRGGCTLRRHEAEETNSSRLQAQVPHANQPHAAQPHTQQPCRKERRPPVELQVAWRIPKCELKHSLQALLCGKAGGRKTIGEARKLSRV